MAIIWQKTHGKTCYQIRVAGNTLRLYTNGVFHSQYNPKKYLTHGVWDLLMLPGYYFQPKQIKRVLVLGVGGGSVIHLLRHHIQPEIIVGVELNLIHLKVARQFFALEKSDAILVHADAIAWLNAYRGPAFDMIIDDMFGNEKLGESERATALNKGWFSVIAKNLSKKGVFVVNIHQISSFKNSAYCSDRQIQNSFASVHELTMPHYGNRVYAFLRRQTTAHVLKNNLNNIANLQLRKAFFNFTFSIKKII